MRKLRITVAIGAVAALVLGSGVKAAPGDDASRPIVIGQIAELTGPYTSLGTDARLGAEQAVAEINAAGGLLNGRKLELIVKDNKTQPGQAVIAFNELNDAGAAAIVGPVYSNAALAVLAQVNRLKLPMISTAASDEQVNPITPYMFIDSPLGSVVARQLLRYFQASKITKIAIAYASDQSFGKDGMTDMTRMAPEYGVQIAATESFATNTTNFSPVLTHVRESGAQALMVWASGPPAVILTKQFADAGMNMQLVMTHAQATTLYTKPAGPAAAGVIVAASLGVVSRHLPDSAVKSTAGAMAAKFESANKYFPSQFAFAGYSAVKLIAAAITKAGSTDRAEIRRALESSNLLTPLGVYKYSDKDHAGLTSDDIVIAQISASGDMVPTPWSAAQLKGQLK